VLRFTGKGLNVQKVRLALSLIARLAYETFYKAVDHVFFMGRGLPHRHKIKKLGLFTV